LPIADCRVKKWCGNFLPYQSVPPRRVNRKSAIPDILGQTTIAEILRSASLRMTGGGVIRYE